MSALGHTVEKGFSGGPTNFFRGAGAAVRTDVGGRVIGPIPTSGLRKITVIPRIRKTVSTGAKAKISIGSFLPFSTASVAR